MTTTQELSELPIVIVPTDKLVKPTDLARIDRREKIKRVIEEYGLWNINKTSLAKQFNVNINTIYNDIRLLVEQLQKDSIQETGFNLRMMYRNIDKRLQKALAEEKNPLKQARIADVLSNSAERETRVLEAFGFKEKVAEKVESKNVTLGINVSADIQRFEALLNSYVKEEDKGNV